MKFTNKHNIPLPLAVWLATDDYDFIGGYNRISATSLIKPTRRFILGGRVPLEERDYDVSDFIAVRMGNAFHDSIERAWQNNYGPALDQLGYPQKLIDRVRINPDPDSLQDTDIPVYLERRGERTIGDFTVSGKFDQAIEGELFDTKSTSVYAFIKGNKDDDYIKQGSIYRWIFPNILTGNQIHIQHIFKDWNRLQASLNPSKYPQSQLQNNSYPLMSLEDTENMISEKIKEIKKYYKAPDSDIPFCTDAELWRSEPAYKYYSDPNKTSGRSTRNFDTLADANKHRAEKGKGIVITVPGKVKACAYCPAFKICEQRKLYDHDDE